MANTLTPRRIPKMDAVKKSVITKAQWLNTECSHICPSEKLCLRTAYAEPAFCIECRYSTNPEWLMTQLQSNK